MNKEGKQFWIDNWGFANRRSVAQRDRVSLPVQLNLKKLRFFISFADSAMKTHISAECQVWDLIPAVHCKIKDRPVSVFLNFPVGLVLGT